VLIILLLIDFDMIQSFTFVSNYNNNNIHITKRHHLHQQRGHYNKQLQEYNTYQSSFLLSQIVTFTLLQTIVIMIIMQLDNK
jgi:hypothetical protein